MKRNIKIIIGLCFITYIALLFYLTIWNRIETLHFIWESGRFEYYIKNSFNIIPFKSVFYIFQNLSLKQVFLNIIGNIIALMPFAFFIPYFFQKNMKPITFLFFMILVSFSIETTQLITVSGSFDIDDIILNSLGAFLAYMFLNISYIKHMIEHILLLKKHKLNILVVGFAFLLCFIFTSACICFIIYMKKDKYVANKPYLILKNIKCEDKEELFYETEYFEYYVSCPERYYIFINHKEYTIKEALDEKVMGIEQLEMLSFNYMKKNKYPSLEVVTNTRELLLKEVEDEEIIELKEFSSYQEMEHQTVYNIYIKPLQTGRTTFTLKITNSNTGELQKEMKYEVVIDENWEVKINMMDKS